MGRFNTYQSDLKFTPQTFEKLAILPMALRKRQDEMEAQNDLIGLNIANTKVAPGYQDAYDEQRKAFDAKSSELAERLSKEGAGNPTLLKEFQNMKRQYNAAASATGIFGAGAQRYKDDLEAERLYTAFGVEKAKQSPEAVRKNWEKIYNDSQEEIRQGLAKDPNYVAKPIVHQYAPEFYDTTTFAHSVKDLLGYNSKQTTSEQLAKMADGLYQDSNGQLVMNTNSEAYKNNRNQLQAFANLMNTQLLDTSSKLNQHLRYNGKDPKEYLKDVQKLVEMMTISERSDLDKITPIGGGNSSSGSDNTPKQSGVMLQPRTERGLKMDIQIPGLNNGQETQVTPANAKKLMRDMEIMEQTGNPNIKTKDYAAAKQMVIDMDESTKDFDIANRQALDAATKKIFAGSEMYPYTSFSDLIQKRKEGRERAVEYIRTIDKTRPDLGQQNRDEAKRNYVNAYDNETEELKQRVREASGRQELLYNQVHYGAAFTDDTDKFYKDAVSYFKNNARFIQDQMGNNSFAYQVNEDGELDPIEKNEIGAEFAKEIRIDSFATKNAKGVPSVGITMVFGEGKDQTMKHLDLEVGDNKGSIAREIVEKIKNSTSDEETRYVLDSVLDSASANQVIPDAVSYAGNSLRTAGASPTQSQMIKTYNKASATGGNKNTINPTGTYQLISQGSHYALNVKQKGDQDFHIYNIEDLLRDRTKPNAGYSQRAVQDKVNAEVRGLITLMKYDVVDGVDSFNRTSNPIVPEDNGSKRIALSLAINEYLEATNKPTLTVSERDNATNRFIEKTRKIGLKSMNKAAFLKH